MLGPDTICLTHLQIVNKIKLRYQIQSLQILNYKFDLNLSKNYEFSFSTKEFTSLLIELRNNISKVTHLMLCVSTYFDCPPMMADSCSKVMSTLCFMQPNSISTSHPSAQRCGTARRSASAVQNTEP